MNPRVRVDEVLAVGLKVALPPEAVTHVTRVLRRGLGDGVDLVSPDGKVWMAKIVSLAPVAVEVCSDSDAADANPAVSVGVWLPVLKGGKSDALIRQLTELGVSRVTPYLSRRTVTRFDDTKGRKRRQRWQVIADEATRQCRRTDRLHVSAIHQGIPAANEPPGVLFYERSRGPSRGVSELPPDALRNVLVGPEGGLESAEVDALVDLGWHVAWLGPRVLRAETAVIVAATLALTKLGEFA